MQDWLNELDKAGITAIVCLNPEDEISLLSPEYRDWRRYRVPHSKLRHFDVPVDDGCAPTGAVMNQVGSYPETDQQDAFLANSLP
ncbi:MAG: hypothetical protein PF508_14040 [Spirochaeta sp.]|nr:hypothetical protein [Spirochaeta sp.]